jgi:hypothetical protein
MSEGQIVWYKPKEKICGVGIFTVWTPLGKQIQCDIKNGC